MRTWPALAALTVLMVASLRGADEAPKPADPGTLIIIDQAGKEHKLKAWKFVTGTRQQPVQARTGPEAKEDKEDKTKEKGQPKDVAKPKPPAGPEVLEFREDNSTNFAKGIVTLVPLDRLRSLDYDNEHKTVTARVAISAKPEDDVKLTGTTKYKGENQLAIEAEVDKGDMGVAAVKFLAGAAKGGIKGIRFPPPKAAEATPGPSALLTANDKEKHIHKAGEVQALYHMPDGSLRLSGTLMFKKTLKVDLAKVKKIHFHPSNKDGTAEADVSLKDGEEHTLTLLRSVTLDDKPATLEGLLGRVPVGYKLFPIHTLLDIRFDEAEKK